jgi:hypothetical protein
MIETKYFPGDHVLNLTPHFTSDNRLIKLNTEGRVLSTDETIEVIWFIEEWPYYAITRCEMSGIILA